MRYAILIKIPSLITLPLISKAENTKTFATLFDFCTKMAKVCLFLCCWRGSWASLLNPHHM